ncbi:MAG: indole-3-glycerol phosphate synthase TrpC [Dehalococcoidia bacterium]
MTSGAATILDTIVARRREDVRAAKRAVPFHELRERVRGAPATIDFAARLRMSGAMGVIAEVKRASPSKGDIAPGIDAGEQAERYAAAGAAAISVLTEPTWFKGTLEDLSRARSAVSGMPSRPALLRKDFIIDEYQVVEGRAAGADSILLIVASLSDGELRGFMELSRAMGMEPLVEVNNASEMERAVSAGAAVVGVNNRDLRDFSVDLGTTDRLATMVPEGVLLVALSGISTRADVERFAAAGAGAVLVGEALMRAEDPGKLIRELIGA